MGPWVQGLLAAWTLFPFVGPFYGSQGVYSYTQGLLCLSSTGSLPKLLRPKGGFPFYGSLGPVLFVHPFVGPWVKGYLLHGPYFLGYDRTRTRKWLKFDCMAAYLNCFPRADFHFKKPRACTISSPKFDCMAAGSKGYLLHGPYFLGYDRTRTRKWLKFDCMAAYLNCVPRADFHFMEA